MPYADNMEVQQPQEKFSQPKCWTRWIRNNKNRLKALSTWPHQHLKMRDGQFRYTIVHALMAGDIEEEVVVKCFKVLRQNSLISLITAKDKEGDTPLHSAIRSGTKAELIKLLMNTIAKPSTKRRLLLELNKKGELPIVNALNLKKWSIVEVLLEECIKCKVLPELTGVDTSVSESKTLLFKAMKRGFICYLEIFLRVCQKCTNSIPVRAMLVPNKRGGYTPWYYFLSLDVEQIQLGLEHLKTYGVDINKLLCDPAGRTSLLHEAYRRGNSDVCRLLIDYGAKLNQLDANKLSPQQRRRRLSLGSRPSTPVLQPTLFENPVNIQQTIVEAKREHIQPEEDNKRNDTNEDERIEQEVHVQESNTEHSNASDYSRTETETVILTGVSESEQQRQADDDEHCVAMARFRLLEALNLELPYRPRQPLTCLCPRQEESLEKIPPVYVASPSWKLELHWKRFKRHFIGDNNLPLLLNWCTSITHYYAQVNAEPSIDELCPIVTNGEYIESFNTMTCPQAIVT